MKKHTIFSAALWSVALRWTNRLIGLVSTLVLVRLLSPDDFGVMAMAMLVIGLAEVVMDFGTVNWLMQRKDATDEDYSLAWSVRLLQMVGVGAVIAIAAPFAASHFSDERVAWVLWTLALLTAVGGLENIGPVAWQKALDFRTPFKLFLVRRVATAVATVAGALFFESYWALVGGMCVSTAVALWAGYAMCPFRPRWTLKGARDLVSASQWLLVNSICGYLNTRVDVFLLGRQGGSSAAGLYTISQEVATLPTSDFLAPMSRALLPGMVQIRDRPDALRWAYLLASGLQATLALPIAVGMAMTAHLIVPVFLGPKWIEATPALQFLALAAGVSTLSYSSSYLQFAFGRFRFIALVSLLSALGFVAVGFAVLDLSSPADVAIGRCIVAVGTTSLFVLAASVWQGVAPLKEVARVYLRPSLATAVMAGALFIVRDHLGGGIYVELATAVCIGAAVYIAVLMFAWVMSGRPNGAESYLLAKVCARIAGRTLN